VEAKSSFRCVGSGQIVSSNIIAVVDNGGARGAKEPKLMTLGKKRKAMVTKMDKFVLYLHF